MAVVLCSCNHRYKMLPARTYPVHNPHLKTLSLLNICSLLFFTIALYYQLRHRYHSFLKEAQFLLHFSMYASQDRYHSGLLQIESLQINHNHVFHPHPHHFLRPHPARRHSKHNHRPSHHKRHGFRHPSHPSSHRALPHRPCPRSHAGEHYESVYRRAGAEEWATS